MPCGGEPERWPGTYVRFVPSALLFRAESESRLKHPPPLPRWFRALLYMASFGDDVSMGDFRPPQGDNGDSNPETAAGAGLAGHTSDGSVLNVQIPAITPRSNALGVGAAGAGGASGGDFGSASPSARETKVLFVWAVGRERRYHACRSKCTQVYPGQSSFVFVNAIP